PLLIIASISGKFILLIASILFVSVAISGNPLLIIASISGKFILLIASILFVSVAISGNPCLLILFDILLSLLIKFTPLNTVITKCSLFLFLEAKVYLRSSSRSRVIYYGWCYLAPVICVLSPTHSQPALF